MHTSTLSAPHPKDQRTYIPRRPFAKSPHQPTSQYQSLEVAALEGPIGTVTTADAAVVEVRIFVAFSPGYPPSDALARALRRGSRRALRSGRRWRDA